MGATLFANFDDFLRFNLFSTLSADSSKKIELDAIQKQIEAIERKPEGEKQNQLPALIHECNALKDKRIKELDEILERCLTFVLPICNDLQGELGSLLQSNNDEEKHMGAAFVRMCNLALERLEKLELTGAGTKLKPANPAMWRFHVCWRKLIHASEVRIAPHVVITSEVAAMDVSDQNAKRPTYHEPPSTAFSMGQVLCCGELMRNNIRDRSIPETYVTGQRSPEIDQSDPHTDVARYGMEMLCHALGTHRSTAFVVHNRKFWIWYFDRQGVVRSHGIDFILDFPRFLVLLLTFQRFGLEEWGIIPELNPHAVRLLGLEASRHNKQRRAERPEMCKFQLTSLDLPLKIDGAPDEVKITLNKWVSARPHSLDGPATALLDVVSDSLQRPLVCKIFHPEIYRQNEGRLIIKLKEFIESTGATPLAKHLPKVSYVGDMSRYGTQRLRSLLNVSTNGARTVRVMVSAKLLPLTSAGGDFLKAWLEIVRFHAYLWKIGVEHGDPSLWNVMYDEEAKCGVLGDYDLSVLRHGTRVPGTDRTGTIPFMALDLLTKEYWGGDVKRLYRHEQESFIWILAFVFLRFANGQEDKDEAVTGQWLSSDYERCQQSKTTFAARPPRNPICKPEHTTHWPMVEAFMDWLIDAMRTRRKNLSTIPDDDVKLQLDDFLVQLQSIATTCKLDSLLHDLDLANFDYTGEFNLI